MIHFLRRIFNKKQISLNSDNFFSSFFNQKTNNRNEIESVLNGNFLEAYRLNSKISFCCDQIKRAIETQKITFFKNEKELEDNLKYKFLNVFDSNFIEKVSTLAIHVMLNGNGYLLKKKDTLYSEINNVYDDLMVLNPDNVSFQRGSYTYRINSGMKQFIEDEVIHFKANNIFCDQSLSKGIVQGLSSELKILASINDLYDHFLKKKGASTVIFLENSLFDASRLSEQLKKSAIMKRNYEQSQGTALLSSGEDLKIHETTNVISQLNLLQFKDQILKEIVEKFGCYEITDGTNRASAEMKRIKFLENTINPLISSIENQLNQFVFEFDQSISLKIERYDIQEVDIVIKKLNNGIITPRMASRMLGYEHLENDDDIDSYFYANKKSGFDLNG